LVDQDKKYKIALIGDSLSGGGAEKVHAQLSIYFDSQGFDVHNCIFVDAVTYEYAGSLLNLGQIKPKSSSITRKGHRFFALQKFIKFNRFDGVIDFRMRPSFIFEFILSRMVYPKNTIFSVRSGIIAFYFPANTFLSRLIYQNKKIVAVSNVIQEKVISDKLANNVISIYNPIDFKKIASQKDEPIMELNYILVVGNMKNDIKQIDRLIVAYSKSILPKQNIKLIVLGDGKFKTGYQKLVEDLNLTSLVVFKGTLQNPFPYYKNAKYLVLSSKNEGFPNVIIESLACESPVVAFDCFSGPREIITNHHNGILVENQNFEKLTEAMDLMISDQELYQNCKSNTLQSVQQFSIEIVGKQWLEYLKQ
jgi:glycosyltransferase involved in cell wall biosynthesis